MMQAAFAYKPKGRLWRAQRRPFARRKTAFYTMKDGLLQCLKQKIPIHIIYEDIITNTHRRGRSGHGGMLGGRSRSTGRHVHRWRQDLPAQRPALRSQGGRAALSAHTAPVLGAPHQDVQGIGYEHRVPLRLLEHPRAARGRV